MLDIITRRRSIRHFLPDTVAKPVIEEVIRAGILAPSAKNRQPWRFIVASGDAKANALTLFQAGLARERVAPLLPASAAHMADAAHTLAVMHQAPVIIFVVNSFGTDLNRMLTPEERVSELCNAQSIGAAIENMALAATGLGLGSLWICNTYFAQAELNHWLDTSGELMAALAIGYADETPPARPRKSLEECVEWRT